MGLFAECLKRGASVFDELKKWFLVTLGVLVVAAVLAHEQVSRFVVLVVKLVQNGLALAVALIIVLALIVAVVQAFKGRSKGD